MTTITKLWLCVAAACSMLLGVSAQSPNRKSLQVEFEYKLEVNSTEGKGRDHDSMVQEVQLWLHNIDQDIVPHLQKKISYEERTRQMPNVKILRIQSEIFNRCYTESDGCRWIKSTLFISYAKPKPEYSVERTALNLVKDYLEAFSKNTSTVDAAYTYPMLVSGTGRFQMRPVARPMNDEEIGIFEGCFSDVFASVVYAFDGDTEITNSKFIYQDFSPADEENSTITVDVKFFGQCRHCDNFQFVSIVEGVIQDSMMQDAFQDQLIYHGSNQNTTYFDDLKMVTYSARAMPSGTPDVGDKSIYDTAAPSTSTGQPWFLYVGVVLVLLIVIFGVALIYWDQKELKELMKEEMSTDSDDSFSTHEENPEKISDSHSSRSGTYDDEYTPNVGGEEMEEKSKEDSVPESTVLSYVKESPMTPSGQQKNEYEIYVY